MLQGDRRTRIGVLIQDVHLAGEPGGEELGTQREDAVDHSHALLGSGVGAVLHALSVRVDGTHGAVMRTVELPKVRSLHASATIEGVLYAVSDDGVVQRLVPRGG